MLSDSEARDVIAQAEALGFVREPTLGGEAGYALYLHDDAQEALGWLRDEIGIDPDALLRGLAGVARERATVKQARPRTNEADPQHRPAPASAQRRS